MGFYGYEISPIILSPWVAYVLMVRISSTTEYHVSKLKMSDLEYLMLSVQY